MVFFATNIIQAQNWQTISVSFVMLLLSTSEGLSSYLNILLRRKNVFHLANLVGRNAKRSGFEDSILTCESLYAVDLYKYRPAYSGGGSVENETSDNGAIPSRWMAYEAMLAGLEMTPFRGGFKEKDLKPKIGEDSMALSYKLLEYLPFVIKWEDHSESHPPLLNSDKFPERRVISHGL